MRLFTISNIIALSACFITTGVADDIDAAVNAGKAKYALCGACHGITGNGQPAPGLSMAPSFLDSKLLKMGPEISALILFKGIKKEDPAAYMGQMMMPLGAPMSDEDVANIITYVRAEFGGVKELVTPEQVAEWRAKHAETAQPTRGELEAMGE